MIKQNELILTESALEDFKIFKMYMEKKNLFLFLFLSAVFKKQQPSVALVKSLTTNKIRTSIQSFISSFMNNSCLDTTNDMER